MKKNLKKETFHKMYFQILHPHSRKMQMIISQRVMMRKEIKIPLKKKMRKKQS